MQWDPARNNIKRAVHAYAAARGRGLELTGRVPRIANIFAAGSPKAGSQWMKALFHHPVVRAETGLFTLPQLDYQENPSRGFPAGTFVPGLYFSHDEFRQVPQRHPRRLVYMFRDPRDLVVSGYHSAIRTHRRLHVPELEDFRTELRALSREEAILRLIEASAPRFAEMQSWVGVADPDVATFRLEQVQHSPETEVPRMLRHCGVDLAPAVLDRLLAEISREALQARDLAQRGDGASHYRVHRESWREVLTPEHEAALERVAPGLVASLGYDR